MNYSSRVRSISESVTLKLNAKAMELQDQGRLVYNLTAGQLPFRPDGRFVECVQKELAFLKSYQYCPVAGFNELRSKVLKYIENSRNVTFPKDQQFDVVVSNGAKHSLINILMTIIDPSDEVILLAPYWVSYSQMVNLCDGESIIVGSNVYDCFTPSIEDIRKSISHKTKAIILNSPNNPTGTHYSKEWMDEFGKLMLEHPDIWIISDEIYYELYYFDPKPAYFYQIYPELLKRTVIVDGISKTLACTGLRIGYAVAPKELVSLMTRLQGQTTSGASSLIQRALVNFDFELQNEFLEPIKVHLRNNSKIVREAYRRANLDSEWYQTTSAFYYLVDFSRTPLMNKFKQNEEDPGDYATEICDLLLEKDGLVMVPGTDFGVKNAARISLVMESGPFEEAMSKLAQRLIS
jgi:aspartate aminotransferase